MRKSQVLPVTKFSQLFLNWGTNDSLSTKMLRLKAITLLALAFMLRPSDIAPKATLFHDDTEQKLTFTTDMVHFSSEGLCLTFFGIKNDVHRTGFEVMVPKHANSLLDPGLTLIDYLARTEPVRQDKSVFLSLRSPFSPLSAAGIGSVLQEAIALAGLAGQGFSAKSFRPTGATVAIEKGLDPHIVQKVGRWKSTEVFYQHYVHSRTPNEFATKVIAEN
jgi:hypothetical protein